MISLQRLEEEVEIVTGERRDNRLQQEDIHDEGADMPGDTPAAEGDGEDGACVGKKEMAGQHSTGHDSHLTEVPDVLSIQAGAEQEREILILPLDIIL